MHCKCIIYFYLSKFLQELWRGFLKHDLGMEHALFITTMKISKLDYPAANPQPRVFAHGCWMKTTSLLAVLFLALAPCFAQADSSEQDKAAIKTVEGGSLLGGKDSSVQAKARPLGLSLVDKVKLAASDDPSATFQKDTLPSVLKLLDQKLGERKAITDTSSMALDPSQLRLATDSEVRVYFIGEGAGYRNTLGFNVNASGLKAGDPKLIFPDASSYTSWLDTGANSGKSPDASAPLRPGDFVNLGSMSAGSVLDFFLISDGASGGKNVFSTTSSANLDHLNHVIAFALQDSPYLILGFEDTLGGGDRDYNDVLFAVDIGKVNVARLVSTPEPALFLVLGSFLGSVLLLDWRQRRTVRLLAPVRARS